MEGGGGGGPAVSQEPGRGLREHGDRPRPGVASLQGGDMMPGGETVGRKVAPPGRRTTLLPRLLAGGRLPSLPDFPCPVAAWGLV